MSERTIEIRIDKDDGRLGMPGHTGYQHYLVLRPTDEGASIHLHSGVGNIGIPMDVWSSRGFTIRCPVDVDGGDVAEKLREHSETLLAAAATYLGDEWDGNDHIGQWERDANGYPKYSDMITEVEDDLCGLRTYWDAGEWIAPVRGDAIREAAQYYAEGRTLDDWAADQTEAHRHDALVDADELAEAIKDFLRYDPDLLDPDAPGAAELAKECGIDLPSKEDDE